MKGDFSMSMRVLVTDGMDASAVETLRKDGYEVVEQFYEPDDLGAALREFDAAIIRSATKIKEPQIDAAKGSRLKLIIRAGVGVDNIAVKYAESAGIAVRNTPRASSNAVAELAIGMMIYMARNRFTAGTGSELQGKTVGIHAYGNVGRLVGRKAKALGMNVVAYDPFIADPEAFENDGVKQAASVEELYAASDYLSLHIPATEQTKKSIGYKLLMSMPEGATLVNTARKEVIDEDALKAALTERPTLKYITDIAPDCKDEMAELFGSRFFATPKKMGAETPRPT